MPYMKKLLTYSIFALILFSLSACNSESHTSVLKKCTTLGDESIAYARANYVKLFHHFNPKKFQNTFQKVEEFDNVTHRNVINTYDIAVRKLKAKDPTTKALISACRMLSVFSKDLVDQAYPRAIAHKSEHDPLTNEFFIEINQIVKFDHNIGEFDKNALSFKHKVEAYEVALKNYINKFQPELPSQKYQTSFTKKHFAKLD